MLVLSRKVGEAIDVDGQIKITIVRVNGNRVRVGIMCPTQFASCEANWQVVGAACPPPQRILFQHQSELLSVDRLAN